MRQRYGIENDMAAEVPDIGVVTLLSETCSYGSTLLVDNGSLVGNGLCGPDISDECLDWVIISYRRMV